MKINFTQAQKIVKFMDTAHNLCSTPRHVSYYYVIKCLKSASENYGISIDKKLAELNTNLYTNIYTMSQILYGYERGLKRDVVMQQKVIDNYEKFNTYYQKAEAFQAFEAK